MKNKPRPWKLWQIESSLACNLMCIMCPWHGHRRHRTSDLIMSPRTWDAVVPFLSQVSSVDFSGGGEPLLQKNLARWIEQAHACGCRTGFLTNGTLLDKASAKRLLSAGIDWIGFSLDGATRETYEAVRINASFHTVIDTIKRIADMRNEKKTPEILINMVLMDANANELDAMVSLAFSLGADRINFKQCDVIRDDCGKGLGLFRNTVSKEIRALDKALKKARRAAEKKGIQTTASLFIPDEMPVCDQDPRSSLFISCLGDVSPCIGMAYGGPSEFMGQRVTMPTIVYGNVLQTPLSEIWQSETAQTLIGILKKRAAIYDRVFYSSDFSQSLYKLNESFEKAAAAMPPPPEACRICPYLYGI